MPQRNIPHLLDMNLCRHQRCSGPCDEDELYTVGNRAPISLSYRQSESGLSTLEIRRSLKASLWKVTRRSDGGNSVVQRAWLLKCPYAELEDAILFFNYTIAELTAIFTPHRWHSPSHLPFLHENKWFNVNLIPVPLGALYFISLAADFRHRRAYVPLNISGFDSCFVIWGITAYPIINP